MELADLMDPLAVATRPYRSVTTSPSPYLKSKATRCASELTRPVTWLFCGRNCWRWSDPVANIHICGLYGYSHMALWAITTV